MKRKLFLNRIMVKKSSTHGYGVFSLKNIRKGEKIEECYMLVSNGGDKKLEDYYFDAKGKHALFTGFGIIYNHSEDPNAIYLLNIKDRIATFKACRNIRKDEEIFIDYGEKWFESRGRKPKM